MSSPVRLACLALALSTTACNTAPPACERLGQAFCEAAAVDCDASRALFVRAELPAAKCEEELDTLRAVLPMLSPDVRAYGLAAFLREVMGSSPKLTPEQLDSLSLSIGLPVIPDAGPPSPGAPAQAGPFGAPGDDPIGPVFFGYMNTPDPPPPAKP